MKWMFWFDFVCSHDHWHWHWFLLAWNARISHTYTYVRTHHHKKWIACSNSRSRTASVAAAATTHRIITFVRSAKMNWNWACHSNNHEIYQRGIFAVTSTVNKHFIKLIKRLLSRARSLSLSRSLSFFHSFVRFACVYVYCLFHLFFGCFISFLAFKCENAKRMWWHLAGIFDFITIRPCTHINHHIDLQMASSNKLKIFHHPTQPVAHHPIYDC